MGALTDRASALPENEAPENGASLFPEGAGHYPQLWTRIYNTPLMIHPDKAALIETVLRTKFLEGHVHAMEGGPLRQHADATRSLAFNGRTKPYAMTEHGVAVIPILGTLVQRGSFVDAMSGLTSYGRIGAMLRAAMADDDVRAVMFEVDSHGGEVHGVFELAEKIFEARAEKPVWAAIKEEAYSAGYALAAAAERIFIPPSGCTGSIGVIAMHCDQSQKDAKAGYVYTPIFAGKWKNDFTEHEPLSNHARSSAQSEVDRYYALFTGGVAKMRGVDERKVRATEAGILAPAQAVELVLADEIATMDTALEMLDAQVARQKGNVFVMGARTAAGSLSQEGIMAEKQSTEAAAGALTAEQQATHAAAITAARDEGMKAGRTEGITAERARISAILSCEEAKDRSSLASHIAFHTDMAAEDARKMLAAAPAQAAQAAADPLAQAMSNVANPKVGADAGNVDDVDAAARRIAGYAGSGTRTQAKH